MAEQRKGGFEGNPYQYAGKVGIGTGPVPLQHWRRERSQQAADALGESIPGTDLRPEVKNGANPKRAERRH